MLLFAALMLLACGEPESEVDRLVGRLCARQAQSDYQTALQTSLQEGKVQLDPEYEAVRRHLGELGVGSATQLARAMRGRCPETYWEVQSIRARVNLSGNATLDRLAMRACARLREPAVAAWLAGEAGTEADSELLEIFQAGRDVEHTDRLFEGALGVHCPDALEQAEAAIRVVSGGWEMMRARLRARETCAKLEHALGQRESARAGALALAWKSEVADLGKVDRITAEVTWTGLPPLDPHNASDPAARVGGALPGGGRGGRDVAGVRRAQTAIDRRTPRRPRVRQPTTLSPRRRPGSRVRRAWADWECPDWIPAPYRVRGRFFAGMTDGVRRSDGRGRTIGLRSRAMDAASARRLAVDIDATSGASRRVLGESADGAPSDRTSSTPPRDR